MSGNIGHYQKCIRPSAALVKEGFDQSKVDINLRGPAEPMSWTNATRRLAVAEVNVLVTYGAPAALAAIRETKGIPIVFAGVYDPNTVGVSAKNVTGISSAVPMTSLLKYAKKIVPFTRLAVVYNEQEPDSVRQVNELRQLESQVRVPDRQDGCQEIRRRRKAGVHRQGGRGVYLGKRGGE
jgi:putative ABC transport system substrate-binding protein